MSGVYDPLDYENLGRSIAYALTEQPVRSLSDLERFSGVGVYALYYTGEFPLYDIIARQNKKEAGSQTIYIGKADAENRRKGNPDQASDQRGDKLFKRILKHRQSIENARNLDVADFQVRALSIVPTWVPLAEMVAIRTYRPLWNAVIDGLGNHDPGKGRRQGERPLWDTMHPGRPWAELLRGRREPQVDIAPKAIDHLVGCNYDIDIDLLDRNSIVEDELRRFLDKGCA